jgi:hypothetical protein
MDTKIEKNFMVPSLVIWILVLANYFFSISFAFSFTYLSESLLGLGFMSGLLLVTWLIFLADVLTTKIYHRYYWFTVLLITPLIAYPFYLVQRSKYLNMARKAEKFMVS